MYRIVSGTTQGLGDTAAFIEMLGSRPGGEFFAAGREVLVTRAPGRLDLMGGIADYSGSLVLELPIASAAHVALQRRADERLSLLSLPAEPDGQRRAFEISLAEFVSGGSPVGYAEARARFSAEAGARWAAYVAGAFLVLMRERGGVFGEGARLLISSQVPEGKGVSSSAALEVAAMQAISIAYGIDLTPRETAFLCQRVENLIAGAPCGVMDQMTSACGERDRLLALLCQPGQVVGTLRLPEELEVWGIDSGIRHSVGGADYGTVRAAAFMGYRIIAEAAGLSVTAGAAAGTVEIEDERWGGYLANVSVREFDERYARILPARVTGEEFLRRYGGITDEVTSVKPAVEYPVRAATAHPIFEHERVRHFAEILEEWLGGGDMQAARLGELMYASHESYSACGLGSEGTDELVRLVRKAGPERGLYGAKITGGGSGGTVAVLGRRGARASVEAVAEEYARLSGLTPTLIEGSSPGAARFGGIRLVRESER